MHNAMTDVSTANQVESTNANHGIIDAELSQEILDGETEVTELWSVQTAEEALARFGFAPGDHIPRREQIKIYERAHKAISAKKKELVDEGRYEEIFWLEDKLSDIKRQFQEMQLKDTEKEQRRQHALYKAAEKTCIAKDKCALHEAERRVEQVCAMREADLERLHLAQKGKLELEISWLPRPRIKYTNRFLDLQKTKAGLLRLHQYKDAHTVHNMLSKLQPAEEEAFLASYNEQISLKRRQLEERQTQDRAKLQKLLTTYRLREKRKREIGANNLRNKLAHSEQSMSHAHHMALKRRPELSQNPSAHWQRRAHFATTAAALRGEQLTQAVKGKTTASTIKVADLTSIHNFESTMSGSITTFEVPASLISAKPVE